MDETAIVIVDTEGFIRHWSREAERAFGHPEENALGRSLDLIVPEEFRQAHWRGFRQAMASGSAKSEGQCNPVPVFTAAGKIAQTPGRLALLRRSDGRVVGAMVIFG